MFAFVKEMKRKLLLDLDMDFSSLWSCLLAFATLLRLFNVSSVMRDLLDHFVNAHLDDTLIFSDKLEMHQKHVSTVFKRLEWNVTPLVKTDCLMLMLLALINR